MPNQKQYGLNNTDTRYEEADYVTEGTVNRRYIKVQMLQ